MDDERTRNDIEAGMVDSNIEVMNGLIRMCEGTAEAAGSTMAMVKDMAATTGDDIDAMVREFEAAQLEGKNALDYARDYITGLERYATFLRQA